MPLYQISNGNNAEILVQELRGPDLSEGTWRHRLTVIGPDSETFKVEAYRKKRGPIALATGSGVLVRDLPFDPEFTRLVLSTSNGTPFDVSAHLHA